MSELKRKFGVDNKSDVDVDMPCLDCGEPYNEHNGTKCPTPVPPKIGVEVGLRVAPDTTEQDHYTACAIQPIDFIVANGMDFLEGNVIKYVARYKRKNGLEDLAKARDYLNRLINREEVYQNEQ